MPCRPRCRPRSTPPPRRSPPSKRPLIIAGAGALGGGSGTEVEALADTLGAGILLSSNAKGLLDDRTVSCLGAVGFLEVLPELLGDADAVIAIGTELASSDFWPEPLSLPETVVRIDIDEVQMLTNATVTHPILADAATAAADLNTRVAGLRSDADAAAARDWTAGWKAPGPPRRRNPKVGPGPSSRQR